MVDQPSAILFAPGFRVRVKEQYPPVHVRTPFYCRGKVGAIERCCGQFPNPELLAYGKYDASPVTLYRVRFVQQTLWGDYDGPDTDTLDIEIYEHWLQPV